MLKKIVFVSLMITSIFTAEVEARTYRCMVNGKYVDLKVPCPTSCTRGTTTMYKGANDSCQNSEEADTKIRDLSNGGRKITLLPNEVTYQTDQKTIKSEEKIFNTNEEFERYKENSNGSFMNR